MPKPTELDDFMAVACRPNASMMAQAILRLIRSNPIITAKVFAAAVKRVDGGPDQEAMHDRLFTELNTFLLQAHSGVPDIVKAAQKGPRESWERQGYARL